MPHSPGQKLGQYEIVSPLGAGGMGEVYRARDSKLKREVAIKVLPADVATDKERLARFQREAEVLASLNHPHIAQVFGLEDGALVMELVEGDDLSQRIARGPIPIDEALPIAKQIAEALEAAHDAGIVHRDLKPGNIKVREDGTVKVLDFGLAKAMDEPKGSSLQDSPTITTPAMTMRGVILGTAAYMSPEQAKGKAVDKRADIWAFGCVLYEMLTGTRAFKGDDVTEIIAEVLKTNVDFSRLPSATPPAIRLLLERCLDRDPRARLRDIGEARLVLAAPQVASAAVAPRSGGLSIGAAALIAVAAMGVAGGGAWIARSPDPPAPRTAARVTWAYAEGRSLKLVVQRNQLTISRNGRVMAGIGTNLWVKPIDRLDWVSVPGTGEATTVFASPDGEWIGYLTRIGIGKVRATGGAAVEVHSVQTSGFGPIAGSWGDDGRIYFVDERGIHAVHHDGGTVETIVTDTVTSVHVLPGSRALLYSRGRVQSVAQSTPQVMLHTFGGDSVVLVEGLSPHFVSPDTLVWKQDNRLRAARLDVAARRLVSAPIDALDEEVAQLAAFAQFDVSDDGTLIYVQASNAGQPVSKLALRTRQGDLRILNDAVHQYSDPRLSPDGRRLALHLSDREDDIWTFDLDRGALTRLTFHPSEDETPVWSPDGQWIAFTGGSRTANSRSVFRRRGDASGNEEELMTGAEHIHVTDWSPDGRTLLLEVMHAQRRSDVVLLDVAGRTTQSLIASTFNEASARLSPDGRWIAYQSDESGRFEIYVQSYPALDRKVQLSTQGGVQPVWARDGSTVYFRTETTLAASRLRIVNGTPQADAPVQVFEDRFVQPQGATHTTYDVTADASVIVLQPPDLATPAWVAEIVGIFNWIDDVRAKLPPR
jgi:eukaryotic-like serine/threonine-protein kinase